VHGAEKVSSDEGLSSYHNILDRTTVALDPLSSMIKRVQLGNSR
jgi:hypothetical protein